MPNLTQVRGRYYTFEYHDILLELSRDYTRRRWSYSIHPRQPKRKTKRIVFQLKSIIGEWGLQDYDNMNDTVDGWNSSHLKRR